MPQPIESRRRQSGSVQMRRRKDMPRYFSLADDLSKHIFKLHDRGYTCSDIDDILKLRPGTARQKMVGFFQADSWAPKRGGTHKVRRFTERERDGMCSLYRTGHSIYQIKKHYNTTYTAVEYVLRKRGFKK